MQNSDFNKSKNTTMPNADKKTFADKVGGMVEKVGHKISEAGAPGVGQKIHDLGDKIEKHHTNPSHPHKA